MFSMAKKGRQAGPRGPYKTEVEDPNKRGTAGICIRQHRMARFWTVEVLADQARVSEGTISALENDEVGFTQASLAKIANALECTVGELFEPPKPKGLASLWGKLVELGPDEIRRVGDFVRGIKED